MNKFFKGMKVQKFEEFRFGIEKYAIIELVVRESELDIAGDEKYHSGYKVQKESNYIFDGVTYSTIELIVDRSLVKNEDEIDPETYFEQQDTEVVEERVDEQSSIEESETVLESSSQHAPRIIATLKDEVIELGEKDSEEYLSKIGDLGFAISGIEAVLSGKQKTHKKYSFSEVV